MTGIIIDSFGKNKLYVFTDGRITCDDYITSDKDLTKCFIRENDSYKYAFVQCGSTSCVYYFSNKLMNFASIQDYIDWGAELPLPDHIKNSSFSLIAFIQDKKTKKIQIVLTDKGEHTFGVDQVEVSILPIFMGSGEVALKSAYEALEIDNTQNEDTYLTKISKCFTAAAKVISSMNDLTRIECIRYKK